MSGELPEVVRAWAAVVERCGHCRAHGLDKREVAGWDGGGGTLTRHLRAAEAGQDGLLSLILRRRMGSEMTLAGELRRFTTSLQTLILMSGERLDFLLTFHPRHIVLSGTAAETLRDVVLLALLWTVDDAAIDIVVALDHDEGGQVVARLESSHAGLIPLREEDQRIQTLMGMLTPLGGRLVRRRTPHDSYEVLITVPTGQEPQ
jgi:hypothetical protein